jgi:SWI/SNF-related matrix-associated actin-dependent regulator 1 of chromatin subfamily A
LPVNVSALWRTLGEFKVEPAIEWITEFLDNNPDRKLVVFAHHRAVITALHIGLARYSPCVIDGSTPPARRAEEVDLFQLNPLARLFIGQTIAAGTSITLTAASDVLMVEQEWTPADNYQAISRVHRIGQTEPVTVYHAYAAGTVDERIAARAKRKTADFNDLIEKLTEGSK